mmetsp:Transcript_18459/g.29140  ORF Transcript_18459/g.29140 Transcript_18459/m.29140 type:complete len:203 (+) Transcript_18459:95-703(+)
MHPCQRDNILSPIKSLAVTMHALSIYALVLSSLSSFILLNMVAIKLSTSNNLDKRLVIFPFEQSHDPNLKRTSKESPPLRFCFRTPRWKQLFFHKSFAGFYIFNHILITIPCTAYFLKGTIHTRPPFVVFTKLSQVIHVCLHDTSTLTRPWCMKNSARVIDTIPDNILHASIDQTGHVPDKGVRVFELMMHLVEYSRYNPHT